MPYRDVHGTDLCYRSALAKQLLALAERVEGMRRDGPLSGDGLARLRRFFRIRNIYNSNAIEGNLLDLGETRLVVQEGLTIAGKSLRDQAEARNLDQALNLLEELAVDDRPITAHEVRQIHAFVLSGIDGGRAGSYRQEPVAISGSRFTPSPPEAIPADMARFGDWLQNASAQPCETPAQQAEWFINAGAAHVWLVLIHPFIDGNGRTARLLMNLMLMRSRWPIAIITREDRQRYYDSLEDAQGSDVTAFLELLHECTVESLDEYEQARIEQRQTEEWAAGIAARFSAPQLAQARNAYEVWRNAMELLKSYARQIVDVVDGSAYQTHISFRDFGMIEFEKYAALRDHKSAKRTWFFRIDFQRGDEEPVRYLWFFGSPSWGEMNRRTDVVLFLARETDTAYYERLDQIGAPNVPHLSEVGYVADEERFAVRTGHHVRLAKVEELVQGFIEEVLRCHFST